MSATFDPRLDILPESQLRLWQELDAVPSDFVLYGGTGLALQLGHRASEDFDFFSSSGFEPDRLRSRLPFFRDLDPKDPEAWEHHERDNLEAFVNRGGLVKVAFFGGLDTLQRVEDPAQATGSRVRVGVVDGFGWHEDASDSSSGKLEGLRGYSRTGVARDRFADGTGGGERDRHKLRSSNKYSSPTIFMVTELWTGFL